MTGMDPAGALAIPKVLQELLGDYDANFFYVPDTLPATQSITSIIAQKSWMHNITNEQICGPPNGMLALAYEYVMQQCIGECVIMCMCVDNSSTITLNSCLLMLV